MYTNRCVVVWYLYCLNAVGKYIILTVIVAISLISSIATVHGKTFAVVHKIQYSLENFRSASGRGHHVLYTASDSRGKTFTIG